MHLRIHTVAAAVFLAALAHGQNLVKDIVVRGNTRVSREAILASMGLKVGAPYSEQQRVTDEGAIEDLGFFSAVRIVGVPTDTGSDWTVRVDVDEFPVIKEVRVTGNTVVSTQEIMAKLTPNLRPGHVLNKNEKRPFSQAISDLYNAKGYLGSVSAFDFLEGSPNTLSIEIIETRVGEISVQGPKVTKDRTLRHLIKTRPGDVYSRDKWRSDLSRLYSTGWFDDVNTDPRPGDDIGIVDLTLDLKEARTGSFNVGLQLDPRNSLAGLVRYAQTNVGGTGKSFGVNFLQSTQGAGPSLDLDYTDPFIDNRDTTLRASLYSRVLFRFQGGLFGTGSSSFDQNDQYYERRTGGSLGFSRPISANTSVGISGRAEEVRTSGLEDNQDKQNFIRQDGQLAILTLGVTRNRRDVDINPSRGDWVQATLEPGYSNIDTIGGLTSDRSILGPNFFGKVSVEYRKYISFGPPRGFKLDDPRKVIAFRARFGSILGDVPFFEQYFAGGVDSVRGYPEDRFWGRQTFTSTLEYRHPLGPAFSLVGFVDYGGAWGGYGTVNSYTQSNDLKLHLGFGPGLSFKAGPLGNIQLYLGFNEDGKSRTHFLIGNSF